MSQWGQSLLTHFLKKMSQKGLSPLTPYNIAVILFLYQVLAYTALPRFQHTG